MAEAPCLEDLLACPRCDAALATVADGSFQCPACQVNFPRINDLPFLFAEPGAAWGEWQARVNYELRRLETRTRQLDQSLSADTLRPATQARLTHVRDACQDQCARLKSLLKELLATGQPAAQETYLALRTRLPSDQGLNTYYQNLHRDWCWGSEENDASWSIVRELLPETPGRVLVLGAGGGRLSYDLHQSSTANLTVALDFNPLLLSAASRISQGDGLQLWEFPIAPRTSQDHAVLRQLQADPIRPGLHYVLGDVLRAPFTAGSFDTVVTPWLIDILPVELQDLANRINGLLAPGGQWLNFGSLAFSHPEEASNYSPEESQSVITDSGFECLGYREDQIPYMCSPASRHGRQEWVASFAARKMREVATPDRYRALPEWLISGRDAVPAYESFQMQAASTRIFAFVMGMIDGKRSIKDMAKLMQSQRLMEQQEAEGVIRDFLIRMYEDSRRAG
ncbi:MAG: methyltransferase domain-containing protein [Gammaproteobacteria bacterium]